MPIHRAIYLPSGFYVVHDTLKLRSDTVLIGLHPGATQIILPDGTPAYQGIGGPKALLEAPKGGSNIVIGIGLYTSGNNRRAVAALWKAGADSMMNDVRFLGGHGTPLPDGSRENPYNENHTADPDPDRHWDSQYPSLWVTDGGGGTFLDIWTPSTFAQAGMVVSDTETEGHAYQISSEHHVHNEIKVRNAAHWSFYAFRPRKNAAKAASLCRLKLIRPTTSPSPISIVIASSVPFSRFRGRSRCPTRGIYISGIFIATATARRVLMRIYDQSHGVELREHEFAWLDISGQAPRPKPQASSPVVARGAKVEKLAGGFFNISGGAVDHMAIFISWMRIGSESTAGTHLRSNSPPSVIFHWSPSIWSWTGRAT